MGYNSGTPPQYSPAYFIHFLNLSLEIKDPSVSCVKIKKNMIILFCDNGFGSKEADYFYQKEYVAEKENKFNIGLVSYEDLTKR
jgi:hypothetical protein